MSARDDLTPEQRATLAQQMGDAQPARNSLLMSFGKAIQDSCEHEHPKWEDLFCRNLVAYMGEKAAPILRRLLDAEAEVDGLRDELAEEKADRNPLCCPALKMPTKQAFTMPMKIPTNRTGSSARCRTDA
ncbi:MULTISPECIES: hypothetical protein [Streptomyces]|uniref:Uncharacterized protein n=2 Tax=Streptomyces TaxID=1883 RepID=A0ABV9J5I4_9ACTN